MKSANSLAKNHDMIDSTVVNISDVNASSSASDNANQNAGTLKECVTQSMEQYFIHLGDEQCSDIYQMVINEVEPALFHAVLKHSRGNQSRAAEILGLNRGTLRKKLKQYNIS